jgi:hypothetical protein
MANIPPARSFVDENDTKYKAAVSEATLYKVGATNNFIIERQNNSREFVINGAYGVIGTPNLGVDGIIRYAYDWELVDIYIFNGETNVGGGSTSLDVKWKPFSSGSYASIFSSIPFFTSASASFETCGIGQSKTGFSAPVLQKTQFNAYDQLRIDILSALSGGISCGIGITWRAR